MLLAIEAKLLRDDIDRRIAALRRLQCPSSPRS
jgi:hypothetical protein